MPTVRVTADCSVPAEAVLRAAHDFSERRAEVFPAVTLKHMEVHELGDHSADVTEGTYAGVGINWERCDYDWSQPGVVTATVTDSNVYAVPGSSWQLRVTAKGPGSEVEMTWLREFRRGPRGRIFGTAFRLFGNRIFAKYARDVLANLERLEGRADV